MLEDKKLSVIFSEIIDLKYFPVKEKLKSRKMEQIARNILRLLLKIKAFSCAAYFIMIFSI